MSTKPSHPEYRPNRWDALVAAAVLTLAAATALLFYLPRQSSGALTVTVTVGAQTVQTVPLAQYGGDHVYTGGGHTLTVRCENGQVWVAGSDCPGQDCVRSGAISRAGQSIVCLPAQVVIRLGGPADAPDLIVG